MVVPQSGYVVVCLLHSMETTEQKPTNPIVFTLPAEMKAIKLACLSVEQDTPLTPAQEQFLLQPAVFASQANKPLAGNVLGKMQLISLFSQKYLGCTAAPKATGEIAPPDSVVPFMQPGVSCIVWLRQRK